MFCEKIQMAEGIFLTFCSIPCLSISIGNRAGLVAQLGIGEIWCRFYKIERIFARNRPRCMIEIYEYYQSDSERQYQ